MLCGHPVIRNKKDGKTVMEKENVMAVFFLLPAGREKVGKHASPAETGIREERE